MRAAPFSATRLPVLILCLAVVLLFENKASAAFIAYWRFENGAGGSAASGIGSILDSSGNGHNGTPVNGPVYSPSVPTGSIPQTGETNALSLDFNGTNQRLFIPDSSAFNLTSFTIEASILVRSSDPSQNSQILFRGDDRGGLDPYYLTVAGSSIRLFIGNETSSAIVAAALPGYDQWIHVAGSLDDATGAMRLYIDGTLASSTVTSIRPLAYLDPSWSPGLGIGSTQGDAYRQYFDGKIDEVRIADRALDPSEFLNAPNPVPVPSSILLVASGVIVLALGSYFSSVRSRAYSRLATVGLRGASRQGRRRNGTGPLDHQR